jgi:hypothetical protein
MTWTAGTASGKVFKGRWRGHTGEYTGTAVLAGVSVAATLVPVAVGGCASVATAPGSSSIALGSIDADTATVTGEAGITPGGDVHFYVCPGEAAPCTPSSSGAIDLGSSSLTGSGNTATATSAAFSPLATGSYCFDGFYTGDGHYGSESDGSTADECFIVVPSSPTISTSPTQATIVLGASDSDTATVTGVAGVTPTGYVHFYVCPGDTAPCTPSSSGVVDLGSSPLAGSGDIATATSAAFSPLSLGTHCFDGVYVGDGHYGTASDGSTADECFTVVRSSPTVTTSPTEASIVLGGSDSDMATVTGEAGITPGGDVHFYVCPGDASPCTPSSSGAADLGSSLLVSSGDTASVDSAGYTPPATGSYCFLAVYGGDNNYTSASDGSMANECFSVTPDASGGAGIGLVALNKVGPHEVLTGGTGLFVVSGTLFLNTNVSYQPWSVSTASVTGTVTLGTVSSGIRIATGVNDTVNLAIDGTSLTLSIAASPPGGYGGSSLLVAVQNAASGDNNLIAAYNYAGGLVLSTRGNIETPSTLQVTGGDALETLGLATTTDTSTVFDSAIGATADSGVDVYGTIDTNDGTYGGESLWPLDSCFEPEGAIASGNATPFSSGYPPGVQMSCAGPDGSSSVNYNAINNNFPQESDPLQGTGAPPNPFTSLSSDACPGMSEQVNPPAMTNGSTTALTPGVYTTPVDLTGNATFEDCSGYSDSPANNGQSEAPYPGIYLFEDGLAIDPAIGDRVTGSNIVLATQSPFPVAGNVPGSLTEGAFTASGAGNGAPCLPSSTLTDLQSGGGAATDETVQPDSGASPCGGTSPAEYGVVAYADSSLERDPSETGTGTNFSLLAGGQGTVDLTGPTTGAYGGGGTPGLVLYQDPNTPANYGFDAETGDSADIIINGVVYNASLPNYGVGSPQDYWDGIGGGVVFYEGGTLQSGFGTAWSDGPTESSGSVVINGTAVVDDFNTDGTTNMTIAGGNYSPPGAQSSAARRTTRSRHHRRSKAPRRSTRDVS